MCIVADPIAIVEYDPAWPVLFAMLRTPLAAALGDLAVIIEHVGSTAVPGLAAKPIIDLDVAIRATADLPAVITRLAPLGYVHEGDLGIAGRAAFASLPHVQRHHLYVCAVESAEYRRHLLFRDYLRTHPSVAAAYAALKRELAVRYRIQRAAYTEARGSFVGDVLAQAAQWAHSTGCTTTGQ